MSDHLSYNQLVQITRNRSWVIASQSIYGFNPLNKYSLGTMSISGPSVAHYGIYAINEDKICLDTSMKRYPAFAKASVYYVVNHRGQYALVENQKGRIQIVYKQFQITR